MSGKNRAGHHARDRRDLRRASFSAADIVFDRFRIKKHMNEAVDCVRRKEHRELSTAGNLLLQGNAFKH